MSQWLVERASSVLEKRSSRRGFLVRAAVVGSAVSVAPVRFLLRPEAAEAYVRPGGCSSGKCTIRYTEFCCSINSGENACPSYSYLAGWWKCRHYTGSKLCGSKDHRFYLDCNRHPDHSCPGGCHCGRSDCDCYQTCCVRYRYPQCHREITKATTNVVCRMVLCRNPCKIYGPPSGPRDYHGACNCTAKYDPDTCSHEACCNCGDCT